MSVFNKDVYVCKTNLPTLRVLVQLPTIHEENNNHNPLKSTRKKLQRTIYFEKREI